jgi:hypothetical protein
MVNPDGWGWLGEISGTGIVGSAVGGFETMSFEGRAGVCADGLVTCGIADKEGIISGGNGDKYEICWTGGEEDWGSGRSESGISHVVCFEHI